MCDNINKSKLNSLFRNKRLLLIIIFSFSSLICNAFACDTILNVTNLTSITNSSTYDCVYVQSGAIFTVDSPLTVNQEMIVYSGGLVTHTGSQTSHLYSVNITAVNLTVNSGGSIDVSGRGYTCVNGPGAGLYGFSGGSGGSYGGIGSPGRDAGPGTFYGSIFSPFDLGSGGGRSYNNCGAGSGGGALFLDISNKLSISGSINSNGGNYFSGYTGGGSGGSIYIISDVIEGTGSITSNGGNGHSSNGGSGGGGRIAMYYTTDTFSGNIQAYSGAAGLKRGAAGTIYLKPSAQTYGDLIIDNNNYALDSYKETQSTFTVIDGTYDFNNIIVRNTGNLVIPVGTTITYNTLNWSSKGIITDNGGTFSLWDSSSDLYIPSTSKLVINSPIVVNSVEIDGILTHTGSQTSHLYSVNITAENLTVNSGGSIDVSGRGYTCVNGPGAGLYGFGGGSGGSYAGSGGSGKDAGPGTFYGSIFFPFDLGSGGGSSYNNCGAGSGGGGIFLDISNKLSISGSINGNGGNYFSGYGGGGSGGSIYIMSDMIEGAGSITSNGGNGHSSNGGSGGGGRIAMYYNTDLFSGNIQAYSGSVGVKHGAAGTIYLKPSAQTYGDLIIDNNNYALNSYQETQSTFTVIDGTYDFNNLIVKNTGNLVIPVGTTITYNTLNWSSKGVITDNGGIFSLWDSSSDLYIPSTSMLVINSPIVVNSVEIDGILTHTGSQTSHLYSVNVTAENLTVNSGGSIDVSGRGYTCRNGPGAGLYGFGGGSGGSYGGVGGSGDDAGAGIFYGSIFSPSNLGSGGGSSYNNCGAGSGGGVIFLDINNKLSISGSINSNGGNYFSGYTGGGSGGSIHIISDTIEGAGSITSNGGNGRSGYGGSGGGGRIAMYYNTDLFSGSKTINTGATGFQSGNSGTIFVCDSIENISYCYNSSTGIVLDTTYFPTSSISVNKVVNLSWLPNHVSWLEEGYSVIGQYNISGLNSDTDYIVYDNSSIVTFLTTDGVGALPIFNLTLFGTHEIVITEGTMIFPYYQDPTPKNNYRNSGLNNITININTAGNTLESCLVEINNVNYSMSPGLPMSWIYTYDITNAREIEFQVFYNISGVESALDKRIIYTYFEQSSSVFPSGGFVSIILSGFILLLYIFFV